MIGFLNISALFGLVAASIPIILHLLNKRKRKVVDFSSLRFLHQLQKKELNRLKLKRLLLLIIRTLIMISIVFAFSRPTLRGYLPGATASTAAVIIIDNSVSMRMSNEGSSLFKIAIESAKEIIETFNETDKLIILSTNGNPGNNVISNWSNPDIIGLDDITDTYGASDLIASVDNALQFLKFVDAANKELYILSDFKSAAINKLNEKEELSEIHTYFIELSSKEINNSISKVDVVTKLLRKGGNAQLEITVSTDNPESENISMDIFLEGTRVGHSTISPTINNDAKVMFSLPIKNFGFLKGYVEINNDALNADNTRFFHLFVPPVIRILAIGSDEDLQFALLALKSYSSFGLKSPVKKINESETDRVITDNYDVIIMSAIPKNDIRFIQRLKLFLNNGGGLLILPGGNFDLPEYNDNYASELSLPKLIGIRQVDNETGGYMSFEFVDWNHPLFSGIFSSNEEKAISAKVKKIYLLDEPNSGTDLIRLGGNIPLIKEFTFGAGHIIMMMSAPLITWNDFPLKGLWVPFISRAIEYSMTGQESFSDTINVGSELQFELNYSTVENNIEINTPDGRIFSLQPINIDNTILTKFSNTNFPGSYILEVGNEQRSIHTVNIDRNETVSDKSIDGFAEAFSDNYLKISSPTDIINEIENSRLGVELWRYFTILAFILLITEMALQKSYTVIEKQD